MEVQSLTLEDKQRFARMIALSVHALSIVNAASAKNPQEATNIAYGFLVDQCPKLYPSPFAGVADLKAFADSVGLDLEITEIPNTGSPSPYMH